MAKGDPNEQVNEPEYPEKPGLLPYAHHVGSAVIRPLDKGKIKGRAMAAMAQQTERQFQQIKEQIDLLAVQAKKLQDRVSLSEQIYHAEMSFEPILGTVYHLYERENGSKVLSMIGPSEWKSGHRFAAFLGTVELLSDHTWEVLSTPDTTDSDEHS